MCSHSHVMHASQDPSVMHWELQNALQAQTTQTSSAIRYVISVRMSHSELLPLFRLGRQAGSSPVKSGYPTHLAVTRQFGGTKTAAEHNPVIKGIKGRSKLLQGLI